MNFRRTIGLFAAAAVSMTAVTNVFAAQTWDGFAPIVQHEIITEDENSEHALRATARVDVPEGVTVDSGDFMWVINMEEDIFNPITGVTADDNTKDEIESITGEESADTLADNDEIVFDTSEDENESLNDENDIASDEADLGETEGARYVKKLRANSGTTITGSSSVVFGLVLILDIPLNEDKFDIGFQFADSEAVNSSIQ
ncbi:MAG: hypothetical protein Q4G33_12205 [bacterium]|nr:hypothetical protein [bacterium]